MNDVDWSTRAPGHRSFVATLPLSGFMLVAGAVAGVYGHSIPVFSVPFETAAKAHAAWCTVEGRVDDAAGDRYLALFANHYALTDAGLGLVLTGITLASMALVLRIRSSDRIWLRTPERRSAFFLSGFGVIGWLWIAMVHSLDTDLRRMYFPACADSIGIPIYANTILAFFATPILVLAGWTITWGFGRLPAPLHQWDAERPLRSWTVTVLFGAVIAATTFLLAASMTGSMSVAAPSFLVAIYLLASTRAALLSPRERREVEALASR